MRALIGLRRELGPGFELLDSEPGALAYTRGGGYVIALNTTDAALPMTASGGSCSRPKGESWRAAGWRLTAVASFESSAGAIGGN